MTNAGLNYTVSPAEELSLAVSRFRPKDPISALTHFTGFIMAVLSMPLLLIRAGLDRADFASLLSLSVFMLSMILLYGASASYHSFSLSKKAEGVLKRIDHGMIFILIAGSYTPVCLIALRDKGGISLLILVWGIALIGIVIKIFFVYCPRWVSSVIYIAMGWSCLLRMGAIVGSLTTSQFAWLLAGGLFYTIGGVIYALKFSFFERWIRGFGAHEVFHLFVMAGSICHFICMYQLAG